MLKRLTALFACLMLLCPAALAWQPTIHLKKVQEAGKGPTAWFASEEETQRLIDLVVAQLKADSGFTGAYSGFKLDEARPTACAGIDQEGMLFVAMLHEKTGILLTVVFDGETCRGTYAVKANAVDRFREYEDLAANTWIDPETQAKSIDEMYLMADETMVIADPALLRQFQADLLAAGQTWQEPRGNMAALALLMHYQFSRAPRTGAFAAEYDSNRALSGCRVMQRASAPEVLTLASLDEESHILVLSEFDTAAMTVTCRLFRKVYTTHMGHFTSLFDEAYLIPQKDILAAMIDVNVALSGE